MRQAVMVKPEQVEMVDVPTPVLKKGEVLIEIKCVGICGSDLHVYHGGLPFVSYPLVLGHEATGVVVETCECKKINVSDKVIILPRQVCGECDPCNCGNYHLCDNLQILGIHTAGLSAEYVAISEQNVVKIPDNVPFDVGTLIEPLAVAVHAVSLAGDISGKNVLVLGAGIVGNLVAQVCKAMGAIVMISGRTDYRLNYAKQLGIDYCINDEKEDLGSAVVKAFGYGADITVECIGIDEAVNRAFTYCRKGGKAIITGIFGEKQLIDIFQLQDKELTVYGSMMYLERDFNQATSLLQQGKVSLTPLITARFSLEEYPMAFKYIFDRKSPIMKVVINIAN